MASFCRYDSVIFLDNAIVSRLQVIKAEIPKSAFVLGMALKYADGLLDDDRFKKMNQADWNWIFLTLGERLEEAGAPCELPSISQLMQFRGRAEAVEYLDRPSDDKADGATMDEKPKRMLSERELKSDWVHLLNCMELAHDLGRGIALHEKRAGEIAKDADRLGVLSDFMDFARSYPKIFDKVKNFALIGLNN